MKVKTIYVKREKGRAKKVTLRWGSFKISFVRFRGEIVEALRMREDGGDDLYIPAAPLKRIRAIAYAIFSEVRTKSEEPASPTS